MVIEILVITNSYYQKFEIMKKQIQQEKEQIILHIQQKLSSLRAHRDQLQLKKSTKYIDGPQRQMPNPIVQIQTAKQSKVSHLQKVALERDGERLKNMYEKKKQLQNCGIKISNPTEIDKYFQDKKWIDQREKMKQKAKQKLEKLKVVEEQMKKTKQFLDKKKVDEKSNLLMQKMNFTSLLKEKTQQLLKYEKLVCKSKLTPVEKDELLFMTFQMLRQWNSLVQKQNLKAFLFANEQFCSSFYITMAQIKRDLEVFSTRQQNMFTYSQFIEFIKSIQLTKPMIEPSQCKNMRKKKESAKKCSIGQKIAEEKTKMQVKPRQTLRKVMQYLRKLFKNLDRGNQGIVQRSKLSLGLEKGLLLTEKQKQNCIKIQDLRQISSLLTKKRKQKNNKNYYCQLDSKFINFTEIQEICKQFYLKEPLKNIAVSNNDSQLSFLIAEKKDPDYNPTELQYSDLSESPQIFEDASQYITGNGKLTPADYTKYGWPGINKAQMELGLKKMDQYYRNVSSKYTYQLLESDSQQYRSDFQQLQQFIKLQQEQAQVSDHQQRHRDIQQKLIQQKRLKKNS